MMKYYFNPLSPNCRKVTATIQHLGLQDRVEMQEVNPFLGQTRTPEYLAINPNGKIPALSDGDFNLWEGNAIVAYLAEQANNTDFWPTGRARIDALRWMMWESGHFNPLISTFLFENILKGMMGAGDPDATKLEQAKRDLDRYGKVLDDQLAGKSFILGTAHPTAADFSVCAVLGYAKPAQVPLDAFANIRSWMSRMDEVPAWQATAHRMG